MCFQEDDDGYGPRDDSELLRLTQLPMDDDDAKSEDSFYDPRNYPIKTREEFFRTVHVRNMTRKMQSTVMKMFPGEKVVSLFINVIDPRPEINPTLSNGNPAFDQLRKKKTNQKNPTSKEPTCCSSVGRAPGCSPVGHWFDSGQQEKNDNF